jgi:phage major head subunit gpT-like protein
MIINKDNLDRLFVAWNAAFKRGLGDAPSYWSRVAMPTTSGGSAEDYGWLGQLPNVREWIGDRVVHNLSLHSYQVKNRDFELTVSVKRNDIEDDRVGIYTPMFDHLGAETREHPDRLVFELLSEGFNAPCYDGQNFFDTEHPVIDKTGNAVSASNLQDGDGPAWFLLDTSRVLKPIIHQTRRAFSLIKKDHPTDDNVFDRKEFVYGVDGRCNVGFGLWQLAYASRQPLNKANYEAARSAMTTTRGDHGKRLGIVPTMLVVPPELDGAGRRLLKTQTADGGGSNEWVDSAELLTVPFLEN